MLRTSQWGNLVGEMENKYIQCKSRAMNIKLFEGKEWYFVECFLHKTFLPAISKIPFSAHKFWRLSMRKNTQV